MFPFLPLIGGGQALTQPLYAVDVAHTIQKVVDDPSWFEGRTVDCFGPEDYTYQELASFVYNITTQNPRVWDLPQEVASVVSKGVGLMGRPMLTEDMVKLLTEDFVPSMTREEYEGQRVEGKVFMMEDFRPS